MLKRHWSRLLAGGLLALGFSLPAHAGVLLSETWDGTVIENSLTISGDPLANLGVWIDFPDSDRWGVVSDAGCTAPCSGSYARHLEQSSDNTNSLYYGIDYGVSAGETFSVQFDYVSSNRQARVGLLGLTAGVSVLDPFAPFWFNGDPDDGESLFSSAEEVLGRTGDWTSVSLTATAASSFDVLAFIVVMGGESGLRGIDNVQVATVPEPSALLLVLAGLMGLGAARASRR